MVSILCDLHKTDGIVFVMGCNYNRDEDLRLYYAATLEKHGVTQAQFDSSLVWYTDNPKRFNKIYPVVVSRLQAEYDSYAWLDKKKDTDRQISPADILPYNFDSVSDVMLNGLHFRLHVSALDSLRADTTLYYIFPEATIDSISLAIHTYSDSLASQISAQ